jgi:tRNA(Ile)-lysidine synthetase-like protein
MEDYNILLEFWFPSEEYQDFWFDKSLDTEIIDKFSDLLLLAEQNKLEHWKETSDGNLALCILYDQITRNIYRNSNFRRNDEKAFNIAKELIVKDTTYPFYKRIFILLPYRHQHTTQLLDFVIDKLSSYTDITDKKLFDRFKLATWKDYSKVTDTCVIHNSNPESKHPEYNSEILDDMCSKYSLIPNNSLDKSIELFELYKTVKQFIINNKINIIGISLSGGVDSMVLAYICYQLKLRGIIDDCIACHVNYGNREESTIEASYIIEWTKYLNIKCITRHITHITRNKVDRNFYEEETRKIRFGLYRFAINKFMINGFCLGHHKDDISENVFMNIMRGKDILDLYGMSDIMLKDNVKIFRPMLEHRKKDIYEMADKFYVCYMKDSTPDWSFRGVIRKKIFPAIDDFDIAMQTNLALAGKKSEEWNQIIELLVIKPILHTLQIGKCGFSIVINNDMLLLPESFWFKILIRIFHKQNINMISHKNLKCLFCWLNKINKQASTICNLSNGYFVIFNNNKLYFINNQLKIKQNIIHSSINIGKIVHNNWLINIEPTTDNIRKSFTYDDIINERFEYTEPYSEPMYMVYTLNKHDSIRKIFKNITHCSSFIPKITSGTKCSARTYVKITFEYNII